MRLFSFSNSDNSFCFNPRICKRCDLISPSSFTIEYVSIHASVKDATCNWCCKSSICRVSIHASVKDATPTARINARSLDVSIHASVKDATRPAYARTIHISFNPRICKRCDFLTLSLLYILHSFNPRICKRCDIANVTKFVATEVSIHASVKDATGLSFGTNETTGFQSTHL